MTLRPEAEAAEAPKALEALTPEELARSADLKASSGRRRSMRCSLSWIGSSLY
ncbi:hypothetical protein AB1399_09730 [Hydrogenibacillus schlegelii]|uniref:hypothetical protein n=1 Tax=Hydrogenibacillus schlegelii TaxID=1484 RepID=UPI0034A02902